MDLKELVRRNRTYRRFHQDHSISLETLKELIDLARFVASAGNLQPLRYLLSNEPSRNALIFPRLKWAGYNASWTSPPEGEKPTAYIVVLNDTEISKNPMYDAGIAVQTILLGAAERGLGGCIIGAVNRPNLRESLKIPRRYEILLVLALGKPKEIVQLEAVGPDGDTRYWRDEAGVHHVPKRSLNEIILGGSNGEKA